MFLKIAAKNVRRSVKEYAIYFFTLALGVAIFYVFNTLETQAVMLPLSANMYEIIRLMNGIMSGLSVFVAFVLGGLIIYASRFLIKKRSREFGIYLTLGMSKRKISQLVLLETFLIGVVSLVVGLLLGVVASQFTSALVANIFEADLSDFQFVFSAEACSKTMLYFGIIYVAVIILNTLIVARKSLLKLLQASKRSETIKTKKLYLLIPALVLSLVLISWAYWMVTENVTKLTQENTLITIIAGAIATLLFFWSISGLILRVVQHFPKLYYKGLNVFILRQFSSKANTAVLSMTIISLLLFVTICVIGVASSVHENMVKGIAETMPVDIEIEVPDRELANYQDILAEHGLDFNKILSESATYSIYVNEDLNLASSLGDVATNLKVENPNLNFDFLINVLRVSEYNQVAKLFHNSQLELSGNEYAIVANYQPMVDIFNRHLAENQTIQIGDQKLTSKYPEVQLGDFQLSSSPNSNSGIVVVSDDAKLPLNKTLTWTVGNYRKEINAKNLNSVIDEFQEKVVTGEIELRDTEKNEIYYPTITTKQHLLDNNVGLNAIVTFVALYLGLIFLIASAAVLALKELSESNENRAKYAILYRIGASEKQINRALFWQIGTFFFAPLAIAIIHSIFGLTFSNYILDILGGINYTSVILSVGGVFVVIYGGYFALTYYCCRNFIKVL